MPNIGTVSRERIRELNDAFRKTFDPSKGIPVLTAGVTSLPSDVRAMAIRKVVTFDEFTEENDPYGEHDFGAFDLEGERFYWKIDYYDPSLNGGSEDPADETKTTRVLTLMLAEEY